MVMADTLRVVVEKLNARGEVTDKVVLTTKDVVRPQSIIDLGFRHQEQIQLLHELQRELLNEQSVFLRTPHDQCPRCGGVLKKKGLNRSDFHAVMTDHKVATQRLLCADCRWSSVPTIHSLFGTSLHPDLTKLQTEMGATHSYRQARAVLDLMVNGKRKVNHHDGIKQRVEAIGRFATTHPLTQSPDTPASELILQVDGGHLKTTESQRSIEAMTAVIYRPDAIEYRSQPTSEIDDNQPEPRGSITHKYCAASALADGQKTLHRQTLAAAKNAGMMSNTRLTAVCDGAENCWSVVDVLRPGCGEVTAVLDWFHISMKFQNARTGNQALNERLMSAKWLLWHGKSDEALQRLEALQVEPRLTKKVREKLKKLQQYLQNNKSYLVSYAQRKAAGLVLTSQMAESTVESLINQRCKGKQHMRWSREGAQAVLSVRAAVWSNSWPELWESWVQETFIKRVA